MPAGKEATVAQEKTQEYRVVVAAVSYLQPEAGFAPDGSPATVQVYKIARFGEIIELTQAQADRLATLGSLQADGTRGPAVKPADAPQSYDEMVVADLEDLVKERGIQVTGSGANNAVLKEDLVNALGTYDQGQSAQ